MKQHLVIKLRDSPGARVAAPEWRRFVNDTSRAVYGLTPAFDRVKADVGLPFWVTREYELAAAGGNPEERAHGLPARAGDIGFDARRGRPDPARLRQADHARAARRVDRGARYRGRHHHAELAGCVAKKTDFVDLNGLDASGFVGDFLGLDDVPQDEVGHGTRVADIIAARGLKMAEGVAPGCSLMAARVLATMSDNGRRVGAGIAHPQLVRRRRLCGRVGYVAGGAVRVGHGRADEVARSAIRRAAVARRSRARVPAQLRPRRRPGPQRARRLRHAQPGGRADVPRHHLNGPSPKEVR